MKLLLLALGAVVLLPLDTDAQRGGRRGGQDRTWKFLANKYDKNKDGKISWKEYQRDKKKFESLDTDGDRYITKDDFGGGRRGGRRGGRGGGRGGRGNRPRGGKVPQAGEMAPDFDLPVVGSLKETKKGKKSSKKSGQTGKKKKAGKTIRLSSFKGKKPVALIFGSYT